MRKTLIFIAITLVSLACNRDIDEFKFSAVVVGAKICSSTQVAYIINVISPKEIGVAYSGSTGEYDNAVIAYRASRILKAGDTIYGVAYITESYAALNCFGIIEKDMPEVILLSDDEKPEE